MKIGVGSASWMAVGAAGFAIFLLAMIYVRRGQDTAAQMAFKARRIDLVAEMQRDLAATSAAAKVDDERRDLAELLSGSDQGERDLLAQFTAAFAELERVDADLLAVAVRSTDGRSLSTSLDGQHKAKEACEVALRALRDAIQAEPIGGSTVRPR